jgi:hypothetical protein
MEDVSTLANLTWEREKGNHNTRACLPHLPDQNTSACLPHQPSTQYLCEWSWLKFGSCPSRSVTSFYNFSSFIYLNILSTNTRNTSIWVRVLPLFHCYTIVVLSPSREPVCTDDRGSRSLGPSSAWSYARRGRIRFWESLFTWHDYYERIINTQLEGGE